jgi:hypothetical protein
MFELADEPLDETTENTLKFLDAVWGVMPPEEGVGYEVFAMPVQDCSSSSSNYDIKQCIMWHALALLPTT